MLSNILSILVFFLPLWAANMSMSFCGFLNGFTPLVDFGKNWPDGRRIVGENKHWGALGVVILIGAVVGWLTGNLWVGFLMGIAAAVGDTLNSFFKRRLAIPAGEPFPLFDQLNYAIVGLIVVAIAVHPLSLEEIALVLLISFLLHRPVCWLGYKLGLRNRPW